MEKRILTVLFFIISVMRICAQTMNWEGKEFEIANVTASVVSLNGEKILKVERDLEKLPFDVNRLGATVDEPTYVKLKDFNLENGIIEVKMMSQIQNPSPFEFAQGFIGVAFRIAERDTAYESIYLRPKVGRSDNQLFRNHTVQYYSYPHYKFDRLRKESEGMYETTAPVDINEWITMRIEVKGQKAYMYINDAKYSSFVVEKMKGETKSGSIGLWVDIGTIGYFKDLKVTKQ